MKAKNKIIIFYLIALLSMPIFNSCNKAGEDDPFTLKSRKARIVGEWELVEGTNKVVFSQINQGSGLQAVNVVQETTYNNGKRTTIELFNGQESYNQTVDYAETWIFNKDNSFEGIVETSRTEGMQVLTEKNDMSGFWSFIDGYDDVKDKETFIIRLFTQDITATAGGLKIAYTGDIYSTNIHRLRKLSNKEIVIESTGTISDNMQVSETTITKTYVAK